MATQGIPKWSKGCPKGLKRDPKSAQGEKKGVGGHPKEANKSQNYIHINKIYEHSRSTVIQRPASIIYIYAYIYIYIYHHISNSLYPIWKYTHKGFRPPHPMPHTPRPRLRRPRHGVGVVGGNPLWVYFHIGYRILDIYLYIHIYICIYVYIYILLREFV